MRMTFAVCAYKESPYLSECIESLLAQTVKCDIYIATSTPCDYIKEIADNYNLPLYIRNGASNIATDWNFAYSKAETEIVCIAHQDDVYLPEYAQSIIAMMENADNPIIAFTGYGERRDSQDVYSNKLLNIKKLMLLPLQCSCFWNSRWMRRRILSLGSPIGCPAVSYNKSNIPYEEIFKVQYRSDVDWQAWELLSRLKGSFCYDKKPNMLHRIHEESATTAIIADNDRTKEDFEMYCKFWPKGIARLLLELYKMSQESNKI